MLATLNRPDSGSARVFGHDVVRTPQIVRQLIGLTGQFASLDEMLSGTENLVLFSRLQGFGVRAAKRKAAELIEECGLVQNLRSSAPLAGIHCDGRGENEN